MTTTPFTELMDHVSDGAPPRVWSFLVTVFGDLAQGDGAVIPGATLTRITDLVPLKPQAVRVALHRLRKDGWIDSHRAGRTTDYGLTPLGRAESAAATHRIYGAAPLAKAAWLAVDAGGAGSGVALGPGLRVVAADPRSAEVLTVPLPPDQAVPPWMQDRLCPPDLARHGADLAHRLTTLAAALPSLDSLSPYERASLRVRIVHEWRRFVLRLPLLPDHLFPKHAHLPDCRAAAMALLTALPRPSLDALASFDGN